MQDTSVAQGDEMAMVAVVESSSRLLTDRRGKLQPPAQALKCPRCESMNTKFCYYNNYNLSQPRHFCKSCRRYWTKGGSLRNVPVGGGCRKNKRSSSASKHKVGSGGGDQRSHGNLAEKAAAGSSSDKFGGASGGGGSSSSSSLVNNMEGSDRSECNNINSNSNTVSSAVSGGVNFQTDLHQTPMLNSGYETPLNTNPTAIFSGGMNWSRISAPLDIQWKQQQSLTSLLTDGRASFDGSAIAEPPPLLEDITSIGEAAISRFLKAAPSSWPSLLQDQQNGGGNNQGHGFDWQTNGGNGINIGNNSEASFLGDLGPWSAGNWPDLSNFGPGSSLP